MTPTLHTARLTLRPLARAEPRVLAQIEAGTAMAWSLVPAGMDFIVGMVGLHHIDRAAASAQLAYEIDAEHSGEGLATEAVERVIQHARTELGLMRLEAHIGPENLRSIRLAERLGFTPETERAGTVVYATRL
jgi:RimJ/RimL family protein N-acetyltransferase